MPIDVQLNIHQLRVFAAVVEHGSLTLASSHLYLTQPAVSVQVRRLQAVVGAPMLRREGRRVVPTEAGLIVYRYARELLATNDALQREVAEMKSGALDHLSLSAGPLYGAYVLPRLLAAFHEKFPRVRLTESDTSTPEAIERVRRNEVDIGIVHPVLARGELDGIHLGVDRQVIIQSADRPLFPEETISLAQIAQLPFVRLRRGASGSRSTHLEHILSAAGLPPAQEVLTVSSWEAVLSAVREGMGVAVAYRSALHKEIQQGSIQILTADGYDDPHNVYLITAPRLHGSRSGALKALTEHLAVEIKGLLASFED